MLTKAPSSKLYLVKGLFTVCQEILKKNVYDFHPYKYGPFSEVLYLDLRLLESRGLIKVDGKNVGIGTVPNELRKKILETYTSQQIYEISHLAEIYRELDYDALLEKIYTSYPYYSIHSSQKKFITKEGKAIQKRLRKTGPAIFSIGYEGITIDEFINRLTKSNVTTLLDIRNNPMSMKFGFSGKTLKRICEERGVKYKSIPELGIQAEIRKPLIKMNDYETLFLDFEENHMPTATQYLEEIKEMLENNERIALMCFEACLDKCHRKIVAQHLYEYCEKKYELQHI